MNRLWLLAVLAACEDVPQPFDLDHARVMAVRIEPPAIAAGATARIDVLVTDSSAEPREAGPDAIAVDAHGLALARDAGGWTVTAPDEAGLVQLRAALAVPAAAPLVVPIELVVDTPDGPLVAQKTIELGAAAENPAPPAITLDGALADPLAIPLDRRSFLGVDPEDPALAYRWFSSVGDLVGYTRAEARIEPDTAAAGLIIVVVRDQAGGTAWTIVPATAF
ncbi:MAG: hypothetical protein ABI867_31100 [Kofleriaceae bacterium]